MRALKHRLPRSPALTTGFYSTLSSLFDMMQSRVLNSHLPIFGKSLRDFDKDRLKWVRECAPGPVAWKQSGLSDRQRQVGPRGGPRTKPERNTESPQPIRSTLLQASDYSAHLCSLPPLLSYPCRCQLFCSARSHWSLQKKKKIHPVHLVRVCTSRAKTWKSTGGKMGLVHKSVKEVRPQEG